MEGIPVKIAVMNNHALGMVKQWQRLFYNERYSAIDLTDHTPDYVKLAEALAEGDLSERARQRAKELANDADLRRRPPKAPVATPASTRRTKIKLVCSLRSKAPFIHFCIKCARAPRLFSRWSSHFI